MRKLTALVCLLTALCALAACAGNQSAPAETTAETTVTEAAAEPTEEAHALPVLADGVYTAEFNTDSSMFHVNEAMDGKGTLTVENGKMTLHVTLASKGILNLFVGKAEDAEKDGAVILEHTEDPVTYKDGFSETVYGFDIPIEIIGEDFDLALIGKKGVWYDHVVSVTNPEKIG